MAKPSEPNAQEPLAAELTDTVLAEPVVVEESKPSKKKGGPLCPHCGDQLREEHDLGDHMHCDNSDCIGCCFEPGVEGPVIRANYPVCPAAG